MKGTEIIVDKGKGITNPSIQTTTKVSLTTNMKVLVLQIMVTKMFLILSTNLFTKF